MYPIPSVRIYSLIVVFFSIPLTSDIDYATQILRKLLNPLAKSMRWTCSIFDACPVPEEHGQIASANQTAKFQAAIASGKYL